MDRRTRLSLRPATNSLTDLPGCALDHPCFIRDPWNGWEERLPDRRQDVIILGTARRWWDAFLTLARVWTGKARIHAVSRNGLLPRSRISQVASKTVFPEGHPSHLSLDEMLASLDAHCHRIRELGLKTALLVDKLRPYTAGLAKLQPGRQTPLPARISARGGTLCGIGFRGRPPPLDHGCWSLADWRSSRGPAGLGHMGDGLTDGLEVKGPTPPATLVLCAVLAPAQLARLQPMATRTAVFLPLPQSAKRAGWSFLTN